MGVIKNTLAILAMVGLTSCSYLYPYKRCKEGIEGIKVTECKMIENFSDEWTGHYIRLTERVGSCAIDIDKGENYRIMVNDDCNNTVDQHMDDNGMIDRPNFGNKYDAEFKTLKSRIDECRQIPQFKLR